MDENGLLNRDGLWNRRGAALAAGIAGAALVGWNYYFFEGLFAAFVLFSLVYVPLLVVALGLSLAGLVGERGVAWMEGRLVSLRHGLKPAAARLPAAPLDGAEGHSTVAFRLKREFQRINRSAPHLARHRAA
jgi:hypothetical protein